MKTNGSILSSISFATISAQTSKSKPTGSVRTNGTIVFNEPANAVVGVKEDNNTFKIGSDATGKLYLVPAKAGEENTVRATKNGDSFMFKQADVFASLGVKPRTKFAVTKETDGEGETAVDYYVLTPSAEKVTAKEEAEATA